MKLFRRRHLFALAALLGAGCERAKAPAASESTAVTPSAVPESSATGPTATTGWNPSAGRLLLVVGESPSQALVYLPDSATASAEISALPHPASVSLFSRAGTVQAADLPDVIDTSGCYTATLNAAPPPRAWNAGFVGGVVAPVRLDSTESIPRADSAALVVQVARLASALPNDPAGRFAGLPFVVGSLWRFDLPDGTQALIANTTRQINQEATPLQERTLLVAEHKAGASDSSFATVYSERSYGDEETIESHDVVAVVLLGENRTPALVVSRDFGDSTAYAIIERGTDGLWHARWTSARRHC
ncbi:MAG TPA: hypothetical protein VHB25_13165 [Gemmatimonadaceae bacterium]|nr:hypothetical protein [Gemmatimonadaceae bacterium]